MKYIIIILVASVIFNVKANANDRTAYTNKNKIAMQAIKNMQMRRFGGTIRQPNSERGSIIFLNKQSIVKAEILEGIVKRWSHRYKYVMEITENNVESSNERIVIKLEDLKRKERIILAPENFWVSINVRALNEDNPPKVVLDNRFEKEVKRAFAFVCGGTCSTSRGGLCGIVDKISDLDSIIADKYTPDVDVRIANNLADTKIKPYRIVKYSEAVEEGWAPAPTNEYQKAIWERVHAAPKNPMKIEFDPKKGR